MNMNTLAARLIGTKFTNHVQPYGSYTIIVEDAEVIASEPPFYGYPLGPTIYFNLMGHVVEGSETSRLFHATSTRSIVGQVRTVRGARPDHIAKGEKITVAM
jgi:hypothetical protein